MRENESNHRDVFYSKILKLNIILNIVLTILFAVVHSVGSRVQKEV